TIARSTPPSCKSTPRLSPTLSSFRSPPWPAAGTMPKSGSSPKAESSTSSTRLPPSNSTANRNALHVHCEPTRVARFSPEPRLRGFLSERAGAHSTGGVLSQGGVAVAGRFLGGGVVGAGTGGLPAHLRRLADGGGHQRRYRSARCLGPRPLRL